MKKNILLSFLLPGIFSLLLSCSSSPPPETVKKVDLKRYIGRWYEIASISNYFQKGCRCTSATYKLDGDQISILNQCLKPGHEKFTEAKGKAWVPDKMEQGKLKVQFRWPFRGNYWILALSSDYRYALVGTPDRRYLWVLSREKALPDKTYQKLVEIAATQGYQTDKLKRTLQNCP